MALHPHLPVLHPISPLGRLGGARARLAALALALGCAGGAALASEPTPAPAADPAPTIGGFKVRPLSVDPSLGQLFNGALLAAAEMGFKADSIDNDGRSANLVHSYQGRPVRFYLQVPRTNTVLGNVLVEDEAIREGFIRLYREQLQKKVGSGVSLMGNISGR